jgi:hypothetical protein
MYLMTAAAGIALALVVSIALNAGDRTVLTRSFAPNRTGRPGSSASLARRKRLDTATV